MGQPRWRTLVRASALLILLAAAACLAPASAVAQDSSGISEEDLAEVFPDASRFGPRQGDPPVIEVFAVEPPTDRERLAGYVFLTSDLPPEVYGYNAPIEVLVGMDLEGRLTGIQVMGYRESLRRSRGDFLDRSSFLRQFTDKHVREPFQIREDIDGISGATITVDAMSRGIRNAARRVAVAYLNRAAPDAPEVYIATTSLDELEGMLWAEILDRGLATQVLLLEGDVRITLSMIHLPDPELGEMLVGTADFEEALAELDARGVLPDLEAEGPSRLMLMGLGGEDSFFFRASALSFVQGADTVAVPGEVIEMLPRLREGKIQGEVRRSGVVVVDTALDLSRPFEVVLDFRPRGAVASASYTVYPPAAAPALASAEPAETDSGPGAEAEPESTASGASGPSPSRGGTPSPGPRERVGGLDGNPGPASTGGSDPTGEAEASPGGTPPASSSGVARSDTDPSRAPQVPPSTSFDFDELLEEDASEAGVSALSRVLARTSWPRVAGFGLLLALVAAAFAFKRPALRWVTLSITLVLLGFYDGGFLSVSHITAGISVGPSVYLNDIPLLLLVGFTVITTLLWGRVFCGFLCPFGALQDVLERIVPRRFRRELPQSVHDRALYAKYGILAIVLAPAIVGSGLSLFQYFEPFGTVFYRSTSLLLWGIAGVVLVASAIVPRFYCRYACPLGAALAIGSLVSPFRIRRVEQCNLCKVCEQKCPTGAIRGPDIDFKECVRCNTCEVQLIEKNGVCAHDMERIRPRLVKLPVAGPGGSAVVGSPSARRSDA